MLISFFLIHHIHNGAQATKSKLDRLLLLSLAGLRLSKAAPGISFSVTTAAVVFEEAFAILQFCTKGNKDAHAYPSSVRHNEYGV